MNAHTGITFTDPRVDWEGYVAVAWAAMARSEGHRTSHWKVGHDSAAIERRHEAEDRQTLDILMCLTEPVSIGYIMDLTGRSDWNVGESLRRLRTAGFATFKPNKGYLAVRP